jgi:hypothetical protein
VGVGGVILCCSSPDVAAHACTGRRGNPKPKTLASWYAAFGKWAAAAIDAIQYMAAVGMHSCRATNQLVGLLVVVSLVVF